MAETVQIVREAPDIEAYKLGLLQEAKRLSETPVGLLQYDSSGKPLMESYEYYDENNKLVTGERQQRDLPTQKIADTTALQDYALASVGAAQDGGIGGYQPYLQEAAYTLGDAAKAIDPSGIGAFMNPFQEAIQQEIIRGYQPQYNKAAAQAIGAGAYGGSRAQVQQSEIQRNMASALAQSQAQNFLQAQQAQRAQGEALGTLGLRQAALGEQAQSQGLKDILTQYDFGKQEQALDQAVLDAQRQNDMAQLYEPYQRLGYLSDVYKGAPTSQSTLTASTAPSVSPFQQYLGLGISGLSAAAGASKAGLF